MLHVVTIYPDLLGTYGDAGNGLVLRRRAELRGVDVVLTEVRSDEPVPAAELYCVGGGEDGPQQLAVARLDRDGTLRRAVDDGAVVLAVCAGLQVLGRSFVGTDRRRAEGLGLLGVDTVGGASARAVGEVVVATAGGPAGAVGALTGFENHAGRTVRDEGVAPLGAVVAGVGNGDGTDGAVEGRVVATYLHGPVLARNPALADWLLAAALGVEALEPLEAGAARGAARRAARRGRPRPLRIAQLVEVSSASGSPATSRPRCATAASTRLPRRRVVSPSTGRIAGPNVTVTGVRNRVRGTGAPFVDLAKSRGSDEPRVLEVARHDRPRRCGPRGTPRRP